MSISDDEATPHAAADGNPWEHGAMFCDSVLHGSVCSSTDVRGDGCSRSRSASTRSL